MVDIEKIKSDFAKVISYSQDLARPKTDIIDLWYEQKKDFIDHFGGEPIVECGEVSLTLSKAAKERIFDEFCMWISDRLYNSEPFIRFLSAQGYEALFDNTVINTYRYGDEEDKIISSGMRLLKAFKFFVTDEQVLATIQNHASTLIQKNKLSGTLCFSVHPLDYLSISESNYNWRSCHALDGEYRSGNLAYMLDKSTIICYIKGEEDVILPHFPGSVPWNNKKWRMLMFVSDNWEALMASRQYPFDTYNSLVLVREKLSPYIAPPDTSWSPWSNKYIESFHDKYIGGRWIMLNHKLVSTQSLMTEPYYPLYYNDLLFSSCYIPYYCYNNDYYQQEAPNFSIGHDVPCLCCGEMPITYTDRMYCARCADENEEYYICDNCGIYISDSARRYLYDIESRKWYTFCHNCFEEKTTICNSCGNTILKTSVRENKKWHRKECPSCAEAEKQKKEMPTQKLYFSLEDIIPSTGLGEIYF